MAALLRRFAGEETIAAGRFAWALWKLQRKEPGWVVGEHMHVFRRTEAVTGGRTIGSVLTAEIERLGELGRSREKRTEGRADGEDLMRFTRVGDDERVSNLDVELAAKLEEDVAKTLTDGVVAGEEKVEE